MVKVTFVEPDGNRRVVDAAIGDTLMTVATGNLVAGVIGECGGGMSCATCHVMVDEEWAETVGGPSEDEAGMLATTATPAGPRSRLSCQLVVEPAFDGLVLHVPESQE